MPKLRFPEFSDEWAQNSLAGLCGMKAGSFISANEISPKQQEKPYPCYGGNGLRGYVNKFNLKGNYTLIGRQGAHCGNVIFVKGEFYATEHAVVVYPNETISNSWLYYQLDRLNLNKFSSGQAQPGLSVETIKTVMQFNPIVKAEQEKIAGFLTVVDEKIDILEQKIKLMQIYKKGLMQQIFSQKLRFKDDNGQNYPAWQTHKLDAVITKSSRKNKGAYIKLVQSVSNKKGLIDQTDQFKDHVVASKDLSNYYVIEQSTFAYNPSRIDVGSLAYKYDNSTTVVSPLYVCFSAKSDLLVDKFLLYWFESSQFLKQMNNSFEGSVRNTLSYESLKRMSIGTPRINEQKKIADFLINIDVKIEAEERLLEKAKEFKKALLQQMFV